MRSQKTQQNYVVGILLGIFVVALVAPALAHDASRPDLNTWFDHLASGKGLCCSLADGVTVQDPDWRTSDGHYQVYLYGQWREVPDDAVITEPNRFGSTMVWPLRGIDGLTIRCFMPGSMT